MTIFWRENTHYLLYILLKELFLFCMLTCVWNWWNSQVGWPSICNTLRVCTVIWKDVYCSDKADFFCKHSDLSSYSLSNVGKRVCCRLTSWLLWESCSYVHQNIDKTTNQLDSLWNIALESTISEFKSVSSHSLTDIRSMVKLNVWLFHKLFTVHILNINEW